MRAVNGAGSIRSRRWLAVGLFGMLAAGCGLFRGAVNASPGLRWWLFSNFGAQRFCPEMLKRGAPLKLTPGGNTIGRFFPSSCQHQVNEPARTLSLQIAGTGYGWTPVAGRVGFAVDVAVEYRPDFHMTDEAVYVWARTNRVLSGPNFTIGAVENRLADWASRTPVGYLANLFGGQIVESQVASGFTVIHTDNGDDFSVGLLSPPARPPHPFHLEDDERIALANETTEIRSGQVDFLGPFEVVESGQALYVHFVTSGQPVDLFVLQRNTSDAWRDGLQRGVPLGPPPVPPVTSFVVQPGAELRQKIRLPAGQYAFVVDNSAVVGVVAPPWNPVSMFGASAAIVSYSVELGDAG